MPIRFSQGDILVFREKNGTRYFAANTKEEAGMACLKILKQRFEEGWYQPYDDDDHPTQPSMTEEAIRALPSVCMKEAGLREWRKYEEEVKERSRANSFYQAVKTALEGQHGNLAIDLIFSRDGAEYEDVKIESLEQA